MIFISVTFAAKMIRNLGARRVSGFRPYLIGGFEGEMSQVIDTALVADLVIQGHRCPRLPMVVVDMKHDMIIGRKWLHEFDVRLNVRRQEMTFGDEGLATSAEVPSPSKKNGTETDARESAREAVHRRLQELESCQSEAPQPDVTPRSAKPSIPDVGSHAPSRDEGIRKMEDALRGTPSRSPDKQAPRPTAEERKKQQQKLDDERRLSGVDGGGAYSLRKDGIGWVRHYAVDVNLVRMETLLTLSERENSPAFVTSLHEIDRYIHDKREEVESMPYDDDELYQQALSQVPKQYHHLLQTFSKAESNRLAPHRECDLKIKLKPGTDLTTDVGYEPLRRMSLEEAEAAKAYIMENLEKGFIEPAVTPWASPVLMAAKPGGGLRFCVDFRKLNDVTEKDRGPLPLIEETLDRLGQARIFTKIDVRQAFHRIRLSEESEYMTTFRTRWGSFKYKVVPFGLSNGPSTFQRYMNSVLMEFLDDFCCAYIDDIIIYSKTEEEHTRHVTAVLQRLRDAGLQADLKKCEFHVQRTKFLGFIVGVDGIETDPEKIEAVRDWKVPTTLKGVQSFLGFCNFYRKFVPEYSRVAKPLTALTRKGEAFRWTPTCQTAFDLLKHALVNAPVLAYFTFGRATRLETDASDGVVAGVLSQRQEDGDWHPVGYFSESMNTAQMNYPIHDKELLAVIRALEFWRPELVGLQAEPFEVITDHRALEYFSTKRLLNRRQANWAGLLAQFNFTLSYRPGTQNVLADALSRHPEDLKTQKDRLDAYRTMRLFRKEPGSTQLGTCDVFALQVDDMLDLALLEASGMQPLPSLAPVEAQDAADAEGGDNAEPERNVVPPAPPEWSGPELLNSLLRSNKDDPALERYRDLARRGHEDWEFVDDQYITHRGKLVVPDHDDLRTKIIDDVHSRITTAHPGRNKTIQMVQRQYWWPGLRADVVTFVANCPCRSAKHPRDKTPGLLKPLPIPHRPWRHLVVDFKSMPEDRSGCNNLLVMIDRLSKTAWCVPCKDTCTAAQAACLYYEGPFRVFGLPESIVSDRGPQFISAFTNELCRILGIKWELSAAGHSQSQGQVENLLQWIDQRLRMFVNHYQDNWSGAIPALDFTQACLPHDSLDGLSPFEVRTGFAPDLPFDWERQTRREDMGSVQERLSRQEAQRTARTLQGYIDKARAAMQEAQDRMVEQANRHRREPDFGIGDYVFIIKKTWVTDRPSDKLDFPLTRQSYRIVGDGPHHSFELEVPPDWRGCKMFTPDRLRRDPRNPLPGQSPPRPEGELIDDEEEWEVEEITASRVHRGLLQYQVQWKGWDPDPEWYPASNFKHAPTALKTYHDQYPDHAGPPRRLQEWLDAQLWEQEVPDFDDEDKPVQQGRQLRRSGRRRGTGVYLVEEYTVDEGVVLRNATVDEVDDTVSCGTLCEERTDEEDTHDEDVADGEIVVGHRQGADYPEEWGN